MLQSVECANNAFLICFLRVFEDHICIGFLWHGDLREGKRTQGSTELMKWSIMVMTKPPHGDGPNLQSP